MRTKNKPSVLLVYCIVLFLAFPDKYMQITASSYSTLSYGIDVSCFQGSIDWYKVGTSSIDFAIIRAGTTSINGEAFSNDSTFERNYNGAVNAGLKVGTYYYCGAYSESGFIKNAYDVLEAIEGKSFDYPVYIDVELASKQMELGKSTLTSYILSALDIISSRGYQAGVYANLDWFNNYVDASRIRERGYNIWLAQYPSGSYTVDPTNYDKSDECSIWQYSNLGSISGISGNVDVDVSYVENEQIPKKNPYPRPTGEPAIEKGMTGPEVGWLQYELNSKGYDIGSCGIDCDFGEDTENAVKAFQSDNSLAPDGIVDFETINALSPISPARHPPEGYLDSVEGGEGCVVVEGWAYDANAAIAYSQKYALNYNSDYNNYNSDGGDCANFVSQCLFAGGLPMTDGWHYYNEWSGVTDSWVGCKSMYNYFNKAGYRIIIDPEEDELIPGNVVLYWSPKYNTWSHAAIIISNNDGETPKIAAHNTDYKSTNWQLGNGWVRRCTIIINGSPPPRPDTDTELGIPFPRPSGNPVLKIGSTGEYVGWVQYALKEKLGYDIGSAGVDCDFGDATETAVYNFQCDHEIEADGIVGPETVQAIVDAIITSPVPPDNSHNPEGFLDSVDGGEGCVMVEGWAYDPDTPNEAVEIHVYMDGGPGKGTGFGGIFADQPSEDINTIMGYPGNHRFSATIQLDVTGEHTFSAYAINRGLGNDNPKLVREVIHNQACEYFLYYAVLFL